MIYVFIVAFVTMAYQASGEGKTAQELDEKVRQTNPYQDNAGEKR